jgi:hypothetical protein
LQAEKELSGNTNALKGEPAQLVKNSRGEVATAETGKEMLMTDNIGIGQAIGMSTPNHKP